MEKCFGDVLVASTAVPLTASSQKVNRSSLTPMLKKSHFTEEINKLRINTTGQFLPLTQLQYGG